MIISYFLRITSTVRRVTMPIYYRSSDGILIYDRLSALLRALN